jgi:AAA+ ATPase superfamily predicted ATPase
MFVNREIEISRLKRVLGSETARLVVIYGRRRCGKSTLLKRIMNSNTIYFSADLREAPLQIKALSERIDNLIPGFAAPVYPGWDSLFRSLNRSLQKRITLCIDEFPYLVKNSPELPSLIQNIQDDGAHSNYNIILCGSSQMMMHDMVLNKKAPLYGRAGEIMKINPMSVHHLMGFLRLTPEEAVREYSVWGGIPRYWEIRKSSASLEEALEYHVVNPYGLLADEPERLFSDEIRTSVQAFTLLSLIGSGCHRLSEIAARMEKPATHLSGALAFLTELKYVRREIPFGESLRSTKKTLYKIDDPFLNFWFTFVTPEKSRIALGLTSQVLKDIRRKMSIYTSSIWEELCRQAVPFLMPDKNFAAAMRWWGRGIDGSAMELDVVAESNDKKVLLAGEVKWSEKTDLAAEYEILKKKTANLLFAKGHKIIHALFVRHKPSNRPENVIVFGPEDVVKALK